jgi:ferredoxin--NADP+ reductase
MPQTTPTESMPTGPELPTVRMHVRRPDDPVEGVVVENERVTARKSAGFIRHIAIDVSGTDLAGAFRPGQSFGVVPPGTDEHGHRHKVRLYSLASPSRGEDGQGNVVATTVKRTIDEHWETGRLFLGVASNFLCDCKPGDRVNLTGPAGKRFLLPARPEEHDYLFFATGTGIAPFRAMLLELLHRKVESRIVLVMGSPYRTDLIYHTTLLRLEEEHPNFTYLTAISRERQGDGHDPMYVHERIRTHADDILPLLDSDRGLVYVCGLAGMELGILKELALRLPDHALSSYLRVEPELMADVGEWTRRMIPRQIRPTRRVFLEVY